METFEAALQEFLSYDIKKDLEDFSHIPTEAWIKIGEQKALENFKLASKAVSAYKDFLKKHKVNPEKIKTVEDFKKIPLTNKKNYFNQYPLKDLVLGGDLSKATVFHYSSGSTGKSLYWPKSTIQDVNTYKGMELVYNLYFDLAEKNSLLINCLAMGPWPAGDIVHTSTKFVADKGSKISIISPGTNPELFFTIFNDLAPLYEQTIIGGYQSFIKDLVDEGLARGIDFKAHNIKFLTGGEKFSELWRDFIYNNFSIDDPYRTVASVYGTSETGVCAFSTPFCDYLRIFLYKDASAKNLFEQKDTPSLTQFIPPARHIEIVNNEIVVTSMGEIPLIRYNSNDYGKILYPEEISSQLAEGFRSGWGPRMILKLPILAIDGRSDGTFTLFGANVYLEQIVKVLETDLKDFVSGRFIVEKTEDETATPVLKLTLETRIGVKPNPKLMMKVKAKIVVGLTKINSEYRNVVKTSGDKAKPRIILKNHRSKEFTPITGKGIIIKN
jgi:phenylacetate-CoA ligase